MSENLKLVLLIVFFVGMATLGIYAFNYQYTTCRGGGHGFFYCVTFYKFYGW